MASSSKEALAISNPGQIRHHGLEIQESLQASLRDFGLVGSVGGVPTRFFQDIPQNHRRGHAGVVAKADVGFRNSILESNFTEISGGLRTRYQVRADPVSPSKRIASGTVASIRESRESWPIWCSISLNSSSLGPTCRSTNDGKTMFAIFLESLLLSIAKHGVEGRELQVAGGFNED